MKNISKDDQINLIELFINLILSISTLVISILGVLNGTNPGQRGNNMIGIHFFDAFTNVSNAIMGICALIMLIEIIGLLLKRIDTINDHIIRLYLMGVNGVVVTFMTVLFFLAPVSYLSDGINGALSNYQYFLFHFHLLNPILAVIGFIILKNNIRFNKKDIIISCLPLLIYSLIYVFNVLFLKTWEDFYGFTFGGHNYLVPVVLIIMYLLSYFISYIFIKLKRNSY